MQPKNVYSLSNKLESTLTRPGLGLLLSVILLIAVSAFSQMNFQTAHHGKEYTMLSEKPFDFAQNNDLQLRILSPLTGYLLFMRGPLFTYFMLVVLAGFLTGVYVYLRRKNFTVKESSLMMTVIGFTTLVFHQLYFPAYTDPGSYLLIILLMMFYRKEFVSILLLSLLLFNHESNIFLFPFFFVLIANGNYRANNLIRVLVLFVISCIPYFLYRSYISSHVQTNFTLEYYLDPVNMKWTREHVLPNLANGIFQSFRFAWIIPVVAIVIDLYQKRFNEALLILSAIVFVMMQFFIAYDISRLAGLAFPALLLGALRLKEFLGNKKFTLLLISIFILNLFIPSYYVGALEPFRYGAGWFSVRD